MVVGRTTRAVFIHPEIAQNHYVSPIRESAYFFRIGKTFLNWTRSLGWLGIGIGKTFGSHEVSKPDSQIFEPIHQVDICDERNQ